MPAYRFRLTWTDGTGAPQSKLVETEAQDATHAAAEIARRNAALAVSPDFRIEPLDAPATTQRRAPSGKQPHRRKARPTGGGATKRAKSRKPAAPGPKRQRTAAPKPGSAGAKKAKRKSAGWNDPLIIRSGIIFVLLLGAFFILQPLIAPILVTIGTPPPPGPPISYTGPSGAFEFRMRGQNRFAFTLSTQGAAAAVDQSKPAGSCQARGEAKRVDDRYVYRDDTCQISFAFAPDGVAVKASRCTAFCGSNATLSGRFGPSSQ